jgi:phage-related protein (TIGR01555 family)
MAETGLVERVKKAIMMDGWANILTGLGIKGRDRRMSAHIRWSPMMREEQEEIYAADGIAKKIIDTIPDEAMEKGYKITGLDPKQLKFLLARLQELRFDERFNEAWKNDRMHGGGGIFKVCEDGGMETRMPDRKLLALNVMTRWDLWIWATNIIGDVTNSRFGEPEAYQLQISEGQKTYSQPIHWTRIVRFPGTYLPRQLRKLNNYWGDSELNRLKNAIRNYSTAHDAIAASIEDFSIPVMKITGLHQLVASNSDQTVIKRLEIANMAKSIARTIILDAEKEEFTHATRQVTGLADLMDKVEGRLVTETNMPKTKLFGTSPKGLGGEGGHEEVNWYDYVKAQQQTYLKPRMIEVIRHIVKTEMKNVDPSTVDIEFNPLWQMDEKEQASVRYQTAQADQIYIQNQVLDPTEVAKSRFGSGKYSIDTTIDMDMREPSGALERPDPPEPPTGKNPKDPKSPVDTSKEGTEDPAEQETTRPGGEVQKKKGKK